MKPNHTRCLVCDTKVFQCVIYAVLLLTTSYFITEMFEEYLEENTNFSVTKQSLTKDDLPTLTICLKSKRVNGTSELKYGRDFKIQTLISTLAPWDPKANATLISLQEGDNEYENEYPNFVSYFDMITAWHIPYQIMNITFCIYIYKTRFI